MKYPVPKWLSNDFFTQCLQHNMSQKNITVLKFTINSAAPPGSSYNSFIARVRVAFKENQEDVLTRYLSLILKTEISHGPITEISDSDDVSEPYFYHKFLPIAREFTDTSTFLPMNYKSPKFDVVLLEDLKERGFLMADRMKQLDFEHCRLYAIASATLHAVSVAVHKKDPELLEIMGKEKMFSHELKCSEMFKSMIKCGIKKLADVADRFDRFKECGRILRDSIPYLWDLIVEAHKCSDSLKTITQGDPWTANMMFKYDHDGSVKEIKLLDFQGLRYGPPINDLVFFFWTSANIDVKKNRREELFQIYLHTLNTKLKEFNCTEQLTYEQFRDSWRRATPLTLLAVGSMNPLLESTTPPPDMSVFIPNESSQNPFNEFYSDSFCNRLPQIFEILIETGVFQFLKHISKT